MSFLKKLVLPLYLVSSIYVLADDSTSTSTEEEKCLSSFQLIIEQNEFLSKPSNALTELSINVCTPYLNNITNGQKPYVCAYTSLFTLISIQNAQRVNANADLEPMKTDYCKNLPSGVEQKIGIIEELYAANSTETLSFINKCVNLLTAKDVVNWWFDPLIPSDTIKVGYMCQAYWDLMDDLHKNNNQTNTNNTAVNYSYVNTYQVYLDEMQYDIYELCTDDELLQSPTDYCNDYMTTKIEFALWNDANELSACTEGVNELEKVCEEETQSPSAFYLATSQCNPCAYTIGYIFERYEHYVEISIQLIFDTITKEQLKSVDDANTEAQELVESEDTSESIYVYYSANIPVVEPKAASS